MSVLNNQQREGVLAQLRGEEIEHEPETQEAYSDEGEQYEEEGSSEYEEDDEETQTGHAVPYSRFSKVIAARNDYAEQAEQSQARITELEEQLKQINNLKQLLGQKEEESYGYNEEPQEVSEIDVLRQSMTEIAEQQQYDLIERELHTIEEQFPNVPQEMLLQAVIDDPSTDMTELAGIYSQHIAEIEEAAIARYTEESGQSFSAESDIPPEIGHTGGRHETPDNQYNATSIREVTERLLKDGIF